MAYESKAISPYTSVDVTNDFSSLHNDSNNEQKVIIRSDGEGAHKQRTPVVPFFGGQRLADRHGMVRNQPIVYFLQRFNCHQHDQRTHEDDSSKNDRGMQTTKPPHELCATSSSVGTTRSATGCSLRRSPNAVKPSASTDAAGPRCSTATTKKMKPINAQTTSACCSL